MCGIVGLVNSKKGDYNKLNKTLKELLILDTVRGYDSTGVALIPYPNSKESPDVVKKVLPGYDFVTSRAYKQIEKNDYMVYIGHNRSATQGTVNMDNAHPFWLKHEKSGKEIMMVHNGTVYNKYSLPNGGEFGTDSEAICNSLIIKGVEDTIAMLDGSFALVWWDFSDQTLNFVRNSERPMYLCVADNKEKLLFASEKWMLHAVVGRHNYKDPKYHMLPEATWYKYNVNDISKPIQKKKVQVLPPTKKTTSSYSSNGGFYSQGSYYGGGNSSYTNPPKGGQTSKTTGMKEQGSQTGGSNSSFILSRAMEEWKDKEIDFMVLDIREYNTAHGNTRTQIEGAMLDSPFNEVRIYCSTLCPDKFSQDDVLTGKIVGVTRNTGADNKIDDLVFILSENSVVWDETKNQVDDEFDWSKLIVKGPKGNVTMSIFEELVKDGCANCTANIFPTDANTLSWTKDSRPICQHCVPDMCNSGILVN